MQQDLCDGRGPQLRLLFEGDAPLYLMTFGQQFKNRTVMTTGARREVFVFVPFGYEYLPGSDESVGATAAAPPLLKKERLVVKHCLYPTPKERIPKVWSLRK